MVWNAVNDPLFGYLQDNSRVPCCSQRRLSILYGAPLYSLAFLLAWFPWRSYAPGDWLSGLHLTVALCAFDGMLTFVLLAQCALFAEISSHHQNRLRLIKYNQVGPSSWRLFSLRHSFHIPSYLFPRWLLSLAHPVSSSVVWFPTTWKTSWPFRHSLCWLLSWAVAACSTQASTARAALTIKHLNQMLPRLLIRLRIHWHAPSPRWKRWHGKSWPTGTFSYLY